VKEKTKAIQFGDFLNSETRFLCPSVGFPICHFSTNQNPINCTCGSQLFLLVEQFEKPIERSASSLLKVKLCATSCGNPP